MHTLHAARLAAIYTTLKSAISSLAHTTFLSYTSISCTIWKGLVWRLDMVGWLGQVRVQ